MNTDDLLLESLNDAQREAVSAEDARLLVLAGAGSGKTRVLVHRIAWLVKHHGISHWEMLGVTFTNKAAHEMRGRVESLLNLPVRGMWLGTFHGLAHRLLRLHWQQAGLPESFQVMDSDDQLRTLRRIMKNMHLDEERWPPRQMARFINTCKDQALRPDKVVTGGDPARGVSVDVYRAYEKVCAEAGLVDFAELLLRTYELLSADPALGDHYRNRFKVILVDEFQDTNAIQYLWLKALVTPATGLFVVGDDDQSIYGWRGACADNIHRVAKEFAPVKICRLEQNYRSTEAILNAANTLIAHNQGRMEKKLWTDQAGGEEIVCHQTFNDRDEAFYVGSKIMAYLEQGGQRSDIAILYRSNAQSRLFEEELLRMGIPYRVYGGQRFFERAEIKDALGYLRLVENRADDPSFERIVNLPTRGIGDQTLQVVRQLARLHGVTLWQAMMLAIEQKQPNGRASEALRRFAHLIDQMDHATAALAPAERCQEVIRLSGLREHFSREKGEKGRNRLENLDELINAVRAWELEWDEQGAMFVPDADAVSLNAGQSSPVADMADMAAMADVDAPGQPGQEMSELAVSRSSSHPPERGALLPLFLSQAVLESGEEGDGQVEESVQMMTLHSAKGLEFPMVFLVGLEQGLFPNRMAIDENRLDEERRLCYVGMTRACEHLICTFAGQRMVYGRIQESAPSQFLYESGLYSPDQYRQGVQHYRHADWNEGAARTPGGGESRGGRHSGAGSRGFEGPSGYGSASRSSYGASQSSGQGFGGRAMAGASMSNRAWDASGGSSASIAKKWGASETGLMLGQSVVHAKFGDGVVMSLEGSGAHARVQVAFERSGTKWLMLAYANLQPR